MSQKEQLNSIILGYRELVSERYEYAQLAAKYEIPEAFTVERVDAFKAYFLTYVYPTPQKREELNEAFDHLDSYIKKPEKLLRLLMDSGRLLFKYGRHLPKILQAGIKALLSFRTATQFEQKLLHASYDLAIKPPFDKPKIHQLIRSLSPEELEAFINSTQSLFETLQDRKLVQRILDILLQLIQRMEARSNLFSPAEIGGLRIGYEIIEGADLLFGELPRSEQLQIFELIVAIEKDFLEQVFAAE